MKSLKLTVVVGAEEGENFATGDDDFLGLAAGEVAIDGGEDAGSLLKSEAV